MNQVSLVVAGAVTPVGKTSTDKRLSVVRSAGVNASLLLAAHGGKVGKEAARQGAIQGLDGLIRECANADYRGLAQYIGGLTGSAVCISSRASFESLPDRFEEAIQVAKAGKNGGYSSDGTKPGAKLALALSLKAFTTELVGAVQKIHAERKAQRAADVAADQANAAVEGAPALN